MAAAKHLHEYYARRLLRNIAVYDTEEVVGMLESKLATANGMGSLGLLPVVCAVMVTDTAMVKLLLEHGADVNAPTPADPPHWIRGEGGKVSEGERALHVACRNGSLPTVRSAISCMCLTAQKNSDILLVLFPFDYVLFTGNRIT